MRDEPFVSGPGNCACPPAQPAEGLCPPCSLQCWTKPQLSHREVLSYKFFHPSFLQQVCLNFFQNDAASSFYTLEKQSFYFPSDQSRPVKHSSVLFIIRASEACALQNFKRGRGPTVIAA